MTSHAPQILIVEDDHALREALLDTASFAGLEATGAADGSAALALLDEQQFDVVISDIQMEPMDGHTLLREVRSRYRDLPVVLMTAYESIQSAVSALRDGATDYLVKPFEAEVLVARIGDWLPPTPAPLEDDVVAVDAVSRRVFELARRVAQSDASVMITGESGVGKEIVFRTIHRHSQRAAQAPVAINCAAIPDNMLEAVLFGYDKGAFTGAYKASPGKFEQAQDSTLLLDEISEMPLALQAKLLRVLQERQVERLGSNKLIDLDVRIVATTNRDLRREVEAGRFREDLYYRLNVMPINVPPLRQRRDDIVPLAKALLARAATRGHQAVPVINAAACSRLLAHHWPGNIRELDNVMQRALILHQGDGINADDLVFEQMTAAVSASLGAGVSEAPRAASPARDDEDDDDLPGSESLGGDLKDHERRLILTALEEGRGSRKFAAEKLGISPRTLRYKLARLRDAGVAVPGVRSDPRANQQRRARDTAMNNTIDAQAVLAQMRALTAQARGLELPRAANAVNPAGGATPAVSFGDVMKNALDFVNDNQVKAAQLSDKFERGDKGVDVAQVMVAIQKANLSFQAATQVRNKLVSAYQDIMNMPL